MRTTCKNCCEKMAKEFINNNSDFCGRKCRQEWKNKHKVKGAKKKFNKKHEEALMSYGLSSSACDSSSVGA